MSNINELSRKVELLENSLSLLAKEYEKVKDQINNHKKQQSEFKVGDIVAIEYLDNKSNIKNVISIHCLDHNNITGITSLNGKTRLVTKITPDQYDQLYDSIFGVVEK